MNRKEEYELFLFRIRIRDILSENIELDERVDDERKIKVAESLYNEILNTFKLNKKESITLFGPSTSPILSVVLFNDVTKEKHPKYIPIKKSIEINCVDYDNLFKNKKYDTIISILKLELIHEITHYLDDERTNTQIIIDYFKDIKKEKPATLTAAEFNAYYISFASKMYDNLKICSSIKHFDLMFGPDAYAFIQNFWSYANPIAPILKKELQNDKIYNTKWCKRLYQLYFELKNKFNGLPNDTLYNKK